MKKVLSSLALLLAGILLTVGFLVFRRYSQNPQQIFPYPYSFSSEAPGISLDAPILIIGDRMGNYFSKFKTELASVISQDLSKSIKIQSLAKDGHALHRSLHELKSLSQWPQILIYQGASEEFREEKFIPSEIPKIKKNFQLYRDDRFQTLLILYPMISRILYEPLNRVKLTETVTPYVVPDEARYLGRLEMEIKLFEEQLTQLVKESRNRNSLLILTTTPINLDIKPKKVCEFATTSLIEKEIRSLEELLQAENYKAAIAKSEKLMMLYSGNAYLHYLHGQINAKLGRIEDAKSALLQASAYDCDPWRATELQNTVIRKVAKTEQVLLFDFAEMVTRGWTESPRFFDDIYPQNIVYEEGVKQLGLVIKRILKL